MLTVQDAARQTGMPETTIRSAMQKGALPYQVQYGRKLIRPSDLEAYRQTARRGRPKKQSAS